MAKSCASWAAPTPSKSGCSVGARRGCGCETVKAATRSGIRASSHVPRYMGPLTGRSREPGRVRRRSGRGGRAAMRGYSRDGPSHAAPTAEMPDSSTILLVDDEDSVQKLLTYPLERDGFRVVSARDGEEALQRFAAEPVDLVVLDIMLPKLDGLEVCKRLRAESSVPIIMLTARDDEFDTVLGLEIGADDYITKPFSIRGFRSRVRALLRRAGAPRPAPPGTDPLVAGVLQLDLDRREARVNGRALELTYVE